MSQNIRNRLSFRSARARLIAKIFFVAIVVVFLSFISFASSLDVTRLSVLWCLGAVVVALVVRSWWKERKQ
jgi:protein-S-isoprenylcysteine O-methyltransferase Ste14